MLSRIRIFTLASLFSCLVVSTLQADWENREMSYQDYSLDLLTRSLMGFSSSDLGGGYLDDRFQIVLAPIAIPADLFETSTGQMNDSYWPYHYWGQDRDGQIEQYANSNILGELHAIRFYLYYLARSVPIIGGIFFAFKVMALLFRWV